VGPSIGHCQGPSPIQYTQWDRCFI
jgi:hypothetical protein